VQSHHRNAPPVALLIALSALGVLPFNMFVPSLPNIAKALETDFATVNIAVAGYAVATAFTHLVTGALSDRFGRKPVLLVALVIFVAGSIGCCIATNIHMFLACRLLQGSAIAGYAISLAVIRDTAGDGAASRIGYVSSAWAVAPMVGPSLGGILDGWLGWRSNFAAFALLGVAGLCLALRYLPETNRHRSTSMAQQFLGYGRLLRSAQFWAYGLCMAFAIGTLYVFIGGAPMVAAEMADMPPAMVGIYMGVVPAGFMVGSYVVGWMGARWRPVRFIVAGRLLTCVGLLIGAALAALRVDHPLAFFGPCVCVGLGNGLTMPVANSRVLSLYPGLSGTALGLASAITAAGAGVIAFAAGLFIDASNARSLVLVAMLATSLVSLVAAVFIARVERDPGEHA
jgi:DHA1 family bicyclomycin/chloramphenicol resistance-like MFS transporter